MKSLKATRKLKHIRQVKYAIRYREQTKARLATVKQQNQDSKEYIVGSLRFANQKAQSVKEARKNAREDWILGPLRPNRAVGPDAPKYGALLQEEMRGPELPKHWFGAKPSVQRRMKTKIPDHILRNQWPIVEGDRVIVTEGKDKNRIGVVDQVYKDQNAVSVKDLNKIWADGRLFNIQPGEKPQPKREWVLSMPYEHVRLVVPYDTVEVDRFGRSRKVQREAIVEAVDVERHTKGINPFTGEYEVGIPEEEQVDPSTEEVAYHRYIAGTRIPIEWPWDKEQKERDLDGNAKSQDRASNKDVQEKVEKPSGLLDRVRNIIGRPRSSKTDNTEGQKADEPEDAQEVDPNTPRVASTRPRAREPQAFDDDSLRHIVEGQVTWVPSLVMPPFPESVYEEIRVTQQERKELDREAADYEEQLQARKDRRAAVQTRKKEHQKKLFDAMKTPLQVKWELEQAQKQKHDPKEQPKVPSELLLAIGKHMQANRLQSRK